MALKIGVDATALLGNRTGIGNYIYPLLCVLIESHPDVEWILYSNDTIHFPDHPRVRCRVSSPKRRGPYWQNTQLVNMLRADRPDIFWASNGLLPLLIPRSLATVVTLHDLVYKFAAHTLPPHSLWGRKLFQPWAARIADRIVAVSRTTATDAHVAYGRSVDAVVWPLPATGLSPIPQASISATRERLCLPERYLLSLGTLEPRKNLSTLVRVYLECRRAGIDLPQLLLAGGKGWKDVEIEAVIASGEQDGLIRRLGYVDAADLPGLYAGCEAFLMPSFYEGFGMPVLEAQLCGAPVIHGPHGSMCEASADMGVICGTSHDELRRMFEALSLGELALTCRLRSTYHWDVHAAAAVMWDQFVAARDTKCGLSAR